MKTKLLGSTAMLGAFALCVPAGAQVCNFRPGPDVIVGDLYGLSNYASLAGMEALSMGTESCNLGDAELDWIASNNNHPVIGQNLYRLKDVGGYSTFEQIGMSWLKHGFAALDLNLCCSNCIDTDGSHLGIGCSDPYSGGLNGSQGNLGPRWQVNALSGFYDYPPANPAWSGSTARRLQVAIADLEPTASTSTRYFGEGHYVTPDDAAAGNHNNNASYRELTVSGSGSAWTFAFTGSTVRETPAILAWQDVDPTVTVRPKQLLLEGLVYLAWQVTDLGAGMWHYEYAVYNMNSDDGIGAFSVPVPPGVTISNIGFHDVTYRDGDGESNVNRDGTDWSVNVGVDEVTWSTEKFSINPNANAIRWGTTYNFRFDADTPAWTADVRLTRFETNIAETLQSSGPSPVGESSAFCNGNDGSLAQCPCGNPGGFDTGCDNVQGTGGVFLEATLFNPDGMGGGTASFTGTGYNPAGTPSYVLLRSPILVAAAPTFDGVLCLGVPVLRVGAGFAIAGTAVEPYTHGAMGGPGVHFYQMWYRNQPAAFCTPWAANLSNGYELFW